MECMAVNWGGAKNVAYEAYVFIATIISSFVWLGHCLGSVAEFVDELWLLLLFNLSIGGDRDNNFFIRISCDIIFAFAELFRTNPKHSGYKILDHIYFFGAVVVTINN